MSLIEWAILIGFGAPILFLSGLFVCWACAMQREEANANG